MRRIQKYNVACLLFFVTAAYVCDSFLHATHLSASVESSFFDKDGPRIMHKVDASKLPDLLESFGLKTLKTDFKAGTHEVSKPSMIEFSEHQQSLSLGDPIYLYDQKETANSAEDFLY